MKLRIRRAAKRTATVSPRPRRRSDLEPVRAALSCLFHGNVPTVGSNDSRWFETVEAGKELIPFQIPRADLATINGALCQGNPDGSINPSRINLSLRFPHMTQLPCVRKAAPSK